jgi:hypothetical protein
MTGLALQATCITKVKKNSSFWRGVHRWLFDPLAT